MNSMLDTFKDPEHVIKIAQKINERISQPTTIMEVCGTHTMSICRFGIRDLLSPEINLISGPGCPVCVTPTEYIDKAIVYSLKNSVIVATFGDLLRVPGSSTSLEEARARGGSILTVYSPQQALEYAKEHPETTVVFLAVGFETTIAIEAVLINDVVRNNLKNFVILSAQKIIPPAMNALVLDEDIGVNGFICPGHVSVIIGSNAYRFIAQDFSIPCVVAGFEPVDILYGIYKIIDQREQGRAEVEIAYERLVSEEGNKKAQKLIDMYFEPIDTLWRGLGSIPQSGLHLRDQYSLFDAEKRFPIDVPPSQEPKGCLCGNILKGISNPDDCPLFGKICTPAKPVGACMVSSEGTCAAWYKYRGSNEVKR